MTSPSDADYLKRIAQSYQTTAWEREFKRRKLYEALYRAADVLSSELQHWEGHPRELGENEVKAIYVQVLDALATCKPEDKVPNNA